MSDAPFSLANVGTPNAPTDPTAVVWAAEAHAVVDGDTFDLVLRGNVATAVVRVRLVGINAPEMHSAVPGEKAAAIAAAQFLAGLLFDAGRQPKPALARVRNPDKFGGRFDADVWVGGQSVAEAMVASGLATRWDGTGPRPRWPFA